MKRIKVPLTVFVLAGLVVFLLFAAAGASGHQKRQGLPRPPRNPLLSQLMEALDELGGKIEMCLEDEAEPRIPIHAFDLPLTITEQNSYYLAESIDFTDPNANAITVECNNVTIDLMGYSIKGPDSGAGAGIYMDRRSNVEVRNGTVCNFYRGIYEENTLGKNHRVINVRAVSNSQSGICLNGSRHLVKGCTASDNGASSSGEVYGILAGSGSTVTDNTANLNGGSATGPFVYGIYGNSGSTVANNTVYGNGLSAGSHVNGIFADRGSTVTGNTVYGNGFSANRVYGICADTGCTVTSNTAYGNGASATGIVYGIYASYGSTVIGNTAFNNGDSATGIEVCGIFLDGSSLVDQNTAYSNGTGASSATNMNACDDCTLGLNHAP